MSIALFVPTILREEGLSSKEYRWLWYCSSLLWLALLQGIRLAYWPLYAGWIALGLYCGVYIPLWVGTCRKLIHTWKIPWQITLPFAWVTWELFRGYFVTGFSACLLGHTLVHQPVLLQIAAHFGGYGVSAMIVVSGALLYQLYNRMPFVATSRKTLALSEFMFPVICIAGWVSYGLLTVKPPHEIDRAAKPLLSVALVQENSPTLFEANPQRNALSWQSYLTLTNQIRETNPELDLVIWPESVFTADHPILDLEPGCEVPSVWAAQGMDKLAMYNLSTELAHQFKVKTELVQQAVSSTFSSELKALPDNDSSKPQSPHLIVGNDLLRVRKNQLERLNVAVWCNRDGKRAGYYAKRHLVMFGEYIPFGDWFPFLYSFLGMAPASSGDSSQTFDLGKGVQLAPTICFENVLPHLNRRAVVESKAAGRDPTVMINLTNDGWFRGSSILDHHLSCATLASVENRRPMLIAANTGLSAWIDGSGHRVAVTKRLSSGTIVARPYLDSRDGLWQTLGDWPWWIVAAACWTLWCWPKSR